MAVTDHRFLEFSRRIAAQCERLGVKHGINPAAAEGVFRIEVAAAVERLSELTGIAKQSSDFLGAVEFCGVGCIHYFRG